MSYFNHQLFLESAPDIKINKSDNTDECLFSIIVPSWNNLDFLKLCVDALKRNSRYTHQIILHLNEALDGSREWAEEQGLLTILTQGKISVFVMVLIWLGP